jgi:predicted small metal-binding protein
MIVYLYAIGIIVSVAFTAVASISHSEALIIIGLTLIGGADYLTKRKRRIGRRNLVLTLRCGDIGGKCEFIVHGETEEEILLKIDEHVESIHGFKGISKIMNEKIRKVIHKENPA